VAERDDVTGDVPADGPPPEEAPESPKREHRHRHRHRSRRRLSEDDDPPQPETTKGKILRYLTTLFWISMAVLSVVVYRRDQTKRKEIEKAFAPFGFAIRRPEILESAGYAATWHDVVELYGDAVVDDALGTVKWKDLTPDAREAWMKALASLDDELEVARRYELEAIAARPGWAFHKLILGQLVYIQKRRKVPDELMTNPEEWMEPLRKAYEQAPGSDMVATWRASAYLEVWMRLNPAQQAEGREIVKRAFLDDDFPRRAFVPAAQVMGPDEAAKLLPETVRALSSAFDTLRVAGGAVDTLWVLEGRLRKAETHDRVERLAELEKRHAKRDDAGTQTRCVEWASLYPIRRDDRPPARRQAARVLELWPDTGSGAWRSDPRGDMARFFLDGRTEDIPGEALGRAVSVLANVPEPIQARARLLANDRVSFDSLVRRSESVGSFEWTPALVELARFELKAGRGDEAAQAIKQIAPRARTECEVLLVRRPVARLQGRAAEVAEVEAALASQRKSTFTKDDWSANGNLSLCIDPEAEKDSKLVLELKTDGPAIFDYGWDEGRLESRYANSVTRLEVPLGGVAGRRAFGLRTVAGPKVEIVATTIVRGTR